MNNSLQIPRLPRRFWLLLPAARGQNAEKFLQSGEFQFEKVGDVRCKIGIKPINLTYLGVVKTLFDPDSCKIHILTE